MTMSDEYTEQDLRRFLATAEKRADTYKALCEQLRCKLSRIFDAKRENDTGHLRFVIEEEVADLFDGWYEAPPASVSRDMITRTGRAKP
jgi:plasmid maintenance system killer protein